MDLSVQLLLLLPHDVSKLNALEVKSLAAILALTIKSSRFSDFALVAVRLFTTASCDRFCVYWPLLQAATSCRLHSTCNVSFHWAIEDALLNKFGPEGLNRNARALIDCVVSKNMCALRAKLSWSSHKQ
mmetsp:Transcript_30698/g.94977  ORF Transcript_30698/g.94977 Transcript_30698/m.94977 type:complete len:129 (+) Transcript_30698:112-498(+)